MPEPRIGAPVAPSLPRRFYAQATAEAGEGGYLLKLDGRSARTPARAPLALPTPELAEAIAAEWNRQVDPATMPLTKLANTVIDGVAIQADGVRDEIVRYAGSDLVFYRAGEPDALVSVQSAAWDPVLAWAREALGARFVLSEGVMFVEQSAAALAQVRSALPGAEKPFRLAALHVLTTLSGSALIALMHAAGSLDVGEAWRIAHVDETYQESRWGADAEALARRAHREAEFRAASTILTLVP